MEIKHLQSYFKGHPNPKFSRPTFKILDGDWEFNMFKGKEEVREAFFAKEPYPLTIRVPFAHEWADSKVNVQDLHETLWYRTHFNYKNNGNDLLLHFERVDFEAHLYINNEYVGKHIGGYSRWSINITKYLIEGNNWISLVVYDSYDMQQPRGKQKWKKEPFECYYYGTSGIWDSVWLEEVSPIYLKEGSVMYKNGTDSLYIEGKLSVRPDSFQLDVIISDQAGTQIQKETFDLNDHIFHLSFRLAKRLEKWDHLTPNLYNVKLVIRQKEHVFDNVFTYFGVVKYETKNREVLINNKPTYLKMVLDQGYWPTSGITLNEQQIIHDITMMQAIGLFGARKHEVIPSSLYLYYADLLGYYTWIEMPSAYEFGERMKENYRRQWPIIVEQNKTHPSVMALVIFNESWGIQQVMNDKDQQDFTVELYHLTKNLAPHCFVISNDGWEHTISDLATMHNYQETKTDLLTTYDDLLGTFIHKKELPPHTTKPLFVNGYDYSGQPLLLTEFAGIAFSKDLDRGWGYGDAVKDNEAFIAKLKGQLEAIEELSDITGYCITQLSDVEQEVNGLLDADHEYKLPIDDYIKLFK